MAAGDEFVPDWRDAEAYEPLLGADRSLFAWEWLRRDRNYRAAAERALDAGGREPSDPAEAPERWGLHAFEPPGRTVPHATPVWSARVYPYVLGADAFPLAGDDVFDLERFRAISTLITTADGAEHLLLSDGPRAIRLDVLAGTLRCGPARLQHRLTGFASAERPLLTLRRLLALRRAGRFCRSLHSREARAKRWILMLRAHDALAAGGEQREIAAVLLSSDAAEPRWRSRSPSVRTQVQRLVRGATHMASDAYRQLLK